MMAKRLLPLFFIWLCFLIALSAQSKKFLKGLILGTLLSQQAMPHFYPMPYYHMTHGHSAW